LLWSRDPQSAIQWHASYSKGNDHMRAGNKMRVVDFAILIADARPPQQTTDLTPLNAARLAAR
jgi:hypothetical protein